MRIDQLDRTFNKHLPNIFLEAVLPLRDCACVLYQVLLDRAYPQRIGLQHDAATFP